MTDIAPELELLAKLGYNFHSDPTLTISFEEADALKTKVVETLRTDKQLAEKISFLNHRIFSRISTLPDMHAISELIDFDSIEVDFSVRTPQDMDGTRKMVSLSVPFSVIDKDIDTGGKYPHFYALLTPEAQARVAPCFINNDWYVKIADKDDVAIVSGQYNNMIGQRRFAILPASAAEPLYTAMNKTLRQHMSRAPSPKRA